MPVKLIKLIFNLLVLTVILSLVFPDKAAPIFLSGALRVVLGAPVKIERARVDLWTGQATFEGIRIENPANFPDGILLGIPKIFVDLDRWALFKGRFHFNTLELDCRDIRVIRAEDGRVNLFSLNIFKSSPARSQGAKAAGPEEGPGRFQVDNLVLTIGFATFTDLSGSSPSQKSFALRVDHAVYRNVETPADIFRIISWELVKRMGLGKIADSLGVSPELPGLGLEQPKGLLEKAVSSLKEKF